MQTHGWSMEAVGAPLVEKSFELGELPADGVRIRVNACGVCHTDLGYLFDGVPTRGGLPRILGHEIAGTVERAGAAAARWAGKNVIVPAVIPCGECDACRRGRTGICPRQVFPGNDVHGGFASHVHVPARGLCEVPASLASRLTSLSVVADAVTTPYHAVVRSELAAGQVAVVVGAGGIGAFAVQIAAAMGAHVIALDVDDGRLALAREHGAEHAMSVKDAAPAELKKTLRGMAKEKGWPASEWRIFETSGTTAGQATAFSLLNFGATLMVVGFAPADVSVRLSNLMAFDARALGVWGCPPDLYPRALELIAAGKIVLDPFIETRPMKEINEVLSDLHHRRIRRRVVLVPDQKE